MNHLNCSLSIYSNCSHQLGLSLSSLSPASPHLPVRPSHLDLDSLSLSLTASVSDSIKFCSSLSSFLSWGRNNNQSHSFHSRNVAQPAKYSQSFSSLLRPLIPEPEPSKSIRLFDILGHPPVDFHGRIPSGASVQAIVLLLQPFHITLKA